MFPADASAMHLAARWTATNCALAQSVSLVITKRLNQEKNNPRHDRFDPTGPPIRRGSGV